jgi:hypothetical protein
VVEPSGQKQIDETGRRRAFRICYRNIVESKRCSGGKVLQRRVLYLGEINDSQQEAWRRVMHIQG